MIYDSLVYKRFPEGSCLIVAKCPRMAGTVSELRPTSQATMKPLAVTTKAFIETTKSK